MLEWCADWYDADYCENSPVRNPKSPDSGSRRVLRGGAFIFPWRVGCAVREEDYPDDRDYGIGLRVVLSPVDSDLWTLWALKP